MDWAAVVLTLIGWCLMPYYRFAAMFLFTVSNLTFMAWAIPLQTWSIVFVQLCFLVLNIRTIYVWKTQEEQ